MHPLYRFSLNLVVDAAHLYHLHGLASGLIPYYFLAGQVLEARVVWLKDLAHAETVVVGCGLDVALVEVTKGEQVIGFNFLNVVLAEPGVSQHLLQTH